MLTSNDDTLMFRKVFSTFNSALFGLEPTPSDNIVIDDGNYDSEVEDIKKELRDSLKNATSTEVDDPSNPPASPVQSIQSEHHVSISVTSTSHISHMVAALPQVSNVINSSVAHPSTKPQDEEISPSPGPRAVRPTAKRKGTKPTQSTSITDPNTAPTETVPAQKKKAKKVVTVEAPTRCLRNCGD